MSSRFKLAAILTAAIVIASAGDYLLAWALRIPLKAATGHKQFGSASRAPEALILGSSLTYSAVDWARVAEFTGKTIESWPVPGSSPAEWEQVQPRSPRATTTFVGISFYDLNEDSLCEFRAKIVPAARTARDLWASRAELPFARRMFAFYASTWLRTVFPTAGLSDRVVFGFRDEARRALGGSADPGEALTVAADAVPAEGFIDWPDDRLLRRLTAMRLSQGTPWFSGPKHQSLLRVLGQAQRQGETIVLVLPVSPLFGREFVTPEGSRRFEASLGDARAAFPDARWVRADHLDRVNSDGCFADLVHANLEGRNLITPEFVRGLAAGAGAQ
jgi:hypothetical protein